MESQAKKIEVISEGRKACDVLYTTNNGVGKRKKTMAWFEANHKRHLPLELLDMITDAILHLFNESLNDWVEEDVALLHYAMSMLTTGKEELESSLMSLEISNTDMESDVVSKSDFLNARNKNIGKLLDIFFTGVLNEDRFHISLSTVELAHLMKALNCARSFNDSTAVQYGEELEAELSKKYAFVREFYVKLIDAEKIKFLDHFSNIFESDYERSKELARAIGRDIVDYAELLLEGKLNPRSKRLLDSFLNRITDLSYISRACQGTDVDVTKSLMRAVENFSMCPSIQFPSKSICNVIDVQIMKDCERQGETMICHRVELVDYIQHHYIEFEKSRNYGNYVCATDRGIWRALSCVSPWLIAIQADHGLGELTARRDAFLILRPNKRCPPTLNYHATSGVVLDVLLSIPVAVAQMRSVFNRRSPKKMKEIIVCPLAILQEKAAKKHKPCQFNLIDDVFF